MKAFRELRQPGELTVGRSDICWSCERGRGALQGPSEFTHPIRRTNPSAAYRDPAGRTGLVKLRIEAGADLNHADNSGKTPLGLAHYRGDIADMLRATGARDLRQKTVIPLPIQNR